MAAITLRDVAVAVDGRDVLRRVDLEIEDAERFVLLGPSGSGKTAILRVIAGLTAPTRGTVLFDGRDVTATPTRDRNLAMVFERGGLQPHLTARRNIGLALWLRRLDRREIDRRVQAESRALSLDDLLDRRPGTLAAGQKHTVMTAKALVRATAAILLDEPFAPLEPTARAATRRTLVTVQRGYGATMVLATHDQDDAMAIADRVAVLRDGAVAACGPPMELYRRPPTAYVGGFLGTPEMRLVRAMAWPTPSGAEIAAGSWRIRTGRLAPRASRRLTLGIRPEHAAVAADDDAPGPRFRGVVRGVDFLGGRWLVRVARPGEDEVAAYADGPVGAGGSGSGDGPPAVGDEVALTIDPARVHVFDDVSGEALVHAL